MKKNLSANRTIILAGSGVVIIALVLIGIFSDRLGAKTYTGTNSPNPSISPLQKCTLSVAEVAAIEKQVQSLQMQVNDLNSKQNELLKESSEIHVQLMAVAEQIAKEKNTDKLIALRNHQGDLHIQLDGIISQMDAVAKKSDGLNSQIANLQNKLNTCTTVLFSPTPTPKPTTTATPTMRPTPSITPIHTPPLKK